MTPTTVEQLQSRHYDAIGAKYEAHYGDTTSQVYRENFINGPMFAGIDLAGRQVLEAMCGNGQTTEFLIERGAIVTGLDLSPAQIESFRIRWPDCKAKCVSIFDSGLLSESFDCVTIVGGLHHIHPRVREAIKEIHRILKPNGLFCFAEPHHGSVPDLVRSFWYRHDRIFAANEASINLGELKQGFADRFLFETEIYRGNMAYLFVLNSMAFRIPLRWKSFYSPLLNRIEAFFSGKLGQRTSCFAICRWRKR